MKNSEDYLDSLLNNFSPEKKNKEQSDNSLTGEVRKRRNQDFLDEFEKELTVNQNDLDELLMRFESELSDEEDVDSERFQEDEQLIDRLDELKKGTARKRQEAQDAVEAPLKQEPEISIPQEPSVAEPEPGIPQEPLNVQPAAAVPEEAPEDDALEIPLEPEVAMDDFSEQGAGETPSQADQQDLMDLLKDASGDSNMAEISQLLDAEKNNIPIDDSLERSAAAGLTDESGAPKEKESIFKKLGRLFFGEEEAEPVFEEEDLSSMSAENLQILQELSAAEDENKKGKKKEKKEKPPKEKKKKEPKEKKVKEKKEKPPKEIDKSPPLPKAPVILIGILAASILILIMITSNLSGYSVTLAAANTAYDQQDYVSAYSTLTGEKLSKQADVDLYAKAKLLAAVQSKYQNCQSFLYIDKFEMALDSLICAYGRCEVNSAEADKLGISADMEALKEKITSELSDEFNVSEADAKAIYEISDRTEYSNKIKAIVTEFGMNKGQ